MERLFRRPVETWCEYLGEEIKVSVECDYQPPEQHAYEDLEITAVWYEDEGNILEQMLEHEVQALRMRMLEDARYYGSKQRYQLADASKKRAQRVAQEAQAQALAEGMNQRRIGA